MNIWQALDLYRDSYALPDSAWNSMAITVDKKVDRDAFYLLGPKEIIEETKAMILADGSCNFQKIITTHMSKLELCFIMSNRTGVLDIYKSNGIDEDKRIPRRVHMNDFVKAIMTLTGTTEVKPKPIPHTGPTINGTPVATGHDAGMDNGPVDEDWVEAKGVDFSQSLVSTKYSPSKVRAQAAAAAGAKVDIKKVEEAVQAEQTVNKTITGYIKKLLGVKGDENEKKG